MLSAIGLPRNRRSGWFGTRSHARRILVEGAWVYRLRARRSDAIKARSRDVSEEVQRFAWHTQVRLCSRYAKLMDRGKNKIRTVLAIGRESAGFVWAIAHEPKLRAT